MGKELDELLQYDKQGKLRRKVNVRVGLKAEREHQ